MASQFGNTLTSFSGADLQVNFGPRIIGELQSISWGVKRQKAPVFTLGSPDPRSFSRGKRGIGGGLSLAQFNRDALIEELVRNNASWKSIAPPAMFTAAGNNAQRGSEVFRDAMALAGWNNVGSAAGGSITNTAGGASTDGKVNGSDTIYNADGSVKTQGTQIRVPAGFGVITAENIMYADMIPPFDVTLTFANEYGQAAFQKIYDLDILDESSGVSVDSIVMEKEMGFVARRISPLMEGVYFRDSSGVMSGKPVVDPTT